MATVTVKSADGDYTTLNAALGGESGALSGILTIECYASAAPETTLADTGTGYTGISSSVYIKITSPAGERHPGYWDGTKYRFQTSIATTGVFIKNQEQYTRIEYMQIYHTGSTPSGDVVGIYDTAGYTRIEKCIIRGTTPTGGGGWSEGILYNTSNPVYSINNVVYNFVPHSAYAAGAGITQDGSGILYAYNCTVWNCERAIWAAASGNGVFKNCIAGPDVEYQNLYYFGANSRNNSTSDDTGDDAGSGSRINQTFSFVDIANCDFRLKRDDTGARRYGLNLYNDATFPFQDDIEGKDRGGSGVTWDIGASMLDFVQVVTVKSADGDYTTRNAALSGESRDLTSFMYQLTIETYAFEDTTNVDSGTGYTVSSTYFIKITSPASERHDGKWNANKSRHKITSYTGWIAAIKNQADYTVIEWQQVDIAPSSSGSASDEINGILNTNGPAYTVVRNCIVRRSNLSFNGALVGICQDTGTLTSYVYRNIVYDMADPAGAANAYGIYFNTPYNSICHNNTVFNSKYGITTSTGNMTLKNNCCMANVVSDFQNLSSSWTSAKNISSDDTSPDGASYQGKTAYSDYFTDYTNKDFHLKSSDTLLKDGGDNLGAPYNVDIDGVTITGTWDIGSDEYVVTSIVGPICWGHADATEDTVRTFTAGWTVGTATISGSGNSEKLTFYAGQTKESEIVQMSGRARIRTNVYLSGSGSPTIEYKTGSSEANCEADSWHTYTVPFDSAGFVKIRITG